MIRFVIVTYPRCGSHMLASALQDRGDVLCQHEAMHGYYEEYLGSRSGSWLYREFWRLPRRTWDRRVFDPPYNLNMSPRDLTAAGFLIHRITGDLIPDHPNLQNRTFARGIWDAIAEDKGVKIVFIHRRNQLKRWASALVASQETWQRYRNDGGAHSKIRIAPTENGLFKNFRWYDEFYAAAKDLLKDHDSTEVVYEELTQRPQEVLHGVQEFLGLDPVDVYPRTFKCERRSLRKTISNYRVLAAGMRRTEFAHFLDDEPEAEVEARAKPTPKK